MNPMIQAHEALAAATQRWIAGGRRKYAGGEAYPAYLEKAMTAYEQARDDVTPKDWAEWKVYCAYRGIAPGANAYDYLA